MPTYTADPDMLRLLAVAVVDATDAALAAACAAMRLSGEVAAVVGTDPVATWGTGWSHSLSERADILDDADPVAATLVDAAHLAITADAVDHALTTPLAIPWERFDDDVSAALAALDWLIAHQRGAVAAGFLATLDPVVATAVARRRPEIGDLPGVPLEVVFAANRRRIELTIDRIDRQMHDADPATANGLTAERDTLTGMLGRTFVVFDWAGDGRIAEWMGPVDADHVVVLVPGTGTDKHDVDRLAEDAARLLRLDGDGDLAVVTGLVYDAPDLADAILSRAADKGIDGLSRLVGLLPVTDRHLTLVGHSYGALLVGKALAAGLAADLPPRHDVVLIGAVGTGAYRAEDLGIDRSRLWVGETTDDWVIDGRRAVDLLGSPLAPVSAFGVLSGVLETTFGVIPTDPGFGGRVFEAGAGGHSGYLAATEVTADDGRSCLVFETASVSAAAILTIATGQRRFAVSRKGKGSTDAEHDTAGR